ncbi:MAG: hypothetical protein WC291_00580 [Thermodesulfovibrionales bacterium]|jgi:hypothetical protein
MTKIKDKALTELGKKIAQYEQLYLVDSTPSEILSKKLEEVTAWSKTAGEVNQENMRSAVENGVLWLYRSMLSATKCVNCTSFQACAGKEGFKALKYNAFSLCGAYDLDTHMMNIMQDTLFPLLDRLYEKYRIRKFTVQQQIDEMVNGFADTLLDEMGSKETGRRGKVLTH